MIKSVLLASLLTLSCGIAVSGDMTQADAFNEGANMGRAYAPPVINSTTAVDHLPSDYYGTTPTATHGLDAVTLYGDGLGDLMTPGVAKNNACMAMVGNPDHKQQVPCDAVKTMNKSDKGGFVFTKNDPLFAKSKAARSDPLGVLSDAGMKFDVTERACVAGSMALPTDTVVKTCSEVMSSTNPSCQPFQDVAIDHLSNFKCNQSSDPLEQQSCNKTLDVVVNVTRCNPGDLLYETNSGTTIGVGSRIAYFRLYCGASPNTIDVKASLGAWCNPGNSSTYIHQAQIAVDENGHASISAYGYKSHYEQGYCVGLGNCTNTRICTGASCPPLMCHPEAGCAGFWKTGYQSWPAGRGDPISALDQQKVMFMSYARRGCATALDSAACDPQTGNCAFNFTHTTEYNWDDSIFGDESYSFQASNIWAMRKVTGVPTWINQCTALEARVQ